MRVTRSTTLLSRQKERQEIVLIPEEILIRIWSFLDFDTIQKICVLVSKSWFDKIRNSMKLSGELKIQCIDQWGSPETHSIHDINAILSNWKKLKVLHVSNEVKIFQFGINLTANKFLEMIVIPGSVSLTELGNWGEVEKFWFDPKRFWIDCPKLENVSSLRIDTEKIPENLDMEKICQGLTNLESLYLYGIANLKSVLLLNFKQLENLVIRGSIKIDDLLDLLHSIGNMKTLEISGVLNIDMDTFDLDKETTIVVFEQAFKIIEENISSRISHFQTFQVHEKKHDLIIDFSNGDSGELTTLRKLMGSEAKFQYDDYESDEEVMDESDENSDEKVMDESDENSDE